MNATTMPSARAFIDKAPIETPLHEVRNPARTSEIVGYAAATAPEQAEQAIESSHRAGPQWVGLTLEERASMIEAALPIMAETLEERALILTREQGKVLWESVADCRGPATVSQYFIDHAAGILATSRTVDDRGTTIKRHVPFGVTAVIVPWNYPVYLSFQHIIPALISGNTVIVKTPENAPLSLAMALEILMNSLPTGVLNVVPGSGSVVGSILSTHPKVRKVLFTGSLAVGRTILHAGADTIKSVGLELGGNDPAIIRANCTLSDTLASEIVRGAFTNAGQICFNIKRVYVHESLLEGFVHRLRRAMDEVLVGDGMDPRSTMGPVNNQREFLRLKELIQRVEASGATVTRHGQAVDPSTWDDGYFLLPHLVTGIDPAHELVQEEQFGPILPVLPYSDEDALVEEINRSEFGLGASVWSDDVDEAMKFGSRVSAGTVFVNLHRMGASDMSMPFGGTKQSGLGRTHGSEILLECTEPQIITHRIDAHKFPGPHLAETVDRSQYAPLQEGSL